MAPLTVATSPPLVAGSTTTATTASFNANAADVLVAVLGCNHYGTTTYSGETFTLSNSGVALSWQLAVKRSNQDRGAAAAGAAIYVAQVDTTRTGMTVGLSVSAAAGTVDTPVLSVYVVPGVDVADMIGAVGGGFSTTNSLTTTGVSMEQADSLLFVAGIDYSAAGTPTSADLTVRAGTTSGALSYLTGYKSSPGAGSSATANLDGAGTASVNWTWVAAELRAATATAAGRLLMISPVGA